MFLSSKGLMPKELAVNDMTKMILVFAAGVIVGVLAATSSIFNGEPEATPVEVVTSSASTDAAEESLDNATSVADAGSDAAMSATESSQVSDEAPAVNDTEAPGFEARTSLEEAEESLAQAEAQAQDAAPAESAYQEVASETEDAVEEVAESVESALTPTGGDDQIFCMQMESSGQCRCYDAETMATADVSPEECTARLAEE